MKPAVLAALTLVAGAAAPSTAAGQVKSPVQIPPNARLLVLTDIEADPDDTQSLVRLLLYSNVIDIEGLVATTSTWKRTSVSPESIEKVVRAYGEVRDNLLLHEDGFPPVGIRDPVRSSHV